MSNDKQHEIEDVGDVVDKISNIPDLIIHHILSFMDTKEAVQTSILAKRWKNLWVSVPNIDFDDISFCGEVGDGRREIDETSFTNFVEGALRLRDASNIKKLYLSCCSRYDESQLHSWISNAIRHNVQELDLYPGRNPSMIPWSILDRTSLVSLKITGLLVTELPSCICFPCLKTLHLIVVHFQDDDCAQKLLVGCPVVEEMFLVNIWNNFVISNSTLKSLTIHDSPESKANHDPTSGCKIKIDAANLTYFEYRGHLPNEILLNNVSFSLVKACIDILPHPMGKKLVTCRAVDLLKRLQYVVSLSVSKTSIKSLMFADNKPEKFEKLSHLRLTTQCIGNKTFAALMDFLNSCPVLLSICLSKGFKKSMCLGENDPIWSSVPICISKCLKTVSLKEFHGYKSEICFLKCVLKYARVLERMDIWWSATYLQIYLQDMNITEVMTKVTEVRTELETTERSSTTCVVKFFNGFMM